MGDVITVNPGEMHARAPIGTARGWRMIYLGAAVVSRTLTDDCNDDPEITRPALRDPVLAALFSSLFARVTAPTPDSFALEQDLLRLLADLRKRRGMRPRRVTRTSPALPTARQRLDESPGIPATLAELAALCGISRFQLMRGFARETGIRRKPICFNAAYGSLGNSSLPAELRSIRLATRGSRTRAT